MGFQPFTSREAVMSETPTLVSYGVRNGVGVITLTNA